MRRRAKIIPFPGSPAPRESAATDPEDERDFAEVRRCGQAEAVVLKSFFESEGIPTLLRSRFTPSLHPFTVGAQGEVRIVVPKAAAGRARRLLLRLVR